MTCWQLRWTVAEWGVLACLAAGPSVAWVDICCLDIHDMSSGLQDASRLYAIILAYKTDEQKGSMP